MEAEFKEKEKQIRIKNFYKSRTGNWKLSATTFYAVKDKQGSRNVNFLNQEGKIITDLDEITQIMQAGLDKQNKEVLITLKHRENSYLIIILNFLFAITVEGGPRK
jgi:hypothetical protein